MKLSRLFGYGNLALTAVLMLAVWLLLVWVASRPAFKTLIDLTPQRTNSVDPVTEQLLAEIREQKVQVEFHTFWVPVQGQPQDEAQQQALAIGDRLRDLTTVLLRRYAWLGGEAVKVIEHDFFRDMDRIRELAPKFGVTGTDDTVVVTVQMPGRERRHRALSLGGDLGVIDAPGMRQGAQHMPGARVPVLKDYKGEEALSSAIKSLLVTGIPVAYLLDGVAKGINPLDPNNTTGGSYSTYIQALRDLGFDVRGFSLSTDVAVPRDASLVAVIEPKREFSDRETRALLEYVKRGGRLFLNYSYSGEPDWNPTGGEFGRQLGFEVSKPPVFHLVPNVNNPNAPGIDGDPSVEKLHVALSPNHPVTRRLAAARRPIQLAAARALQPIDGGSGIRREDLLQTGQWAWLGRIDAAGRVSYQAPRAGFQGFPVGYAIEVDGKDLNDQPATGQVIVISGLFCNNLGMQLNADLGLNVANWMAERRVLLDIQGSNYVARQLKLSVGQLNNIWWLLIVAVPALFLLGGIAVVWLRRRV
ncbi:MAG: Gldg family protein [Planctomycetes bacterium]|nr:Gldg family protein [Planctomycetota bacterium]